MTRFVIQLMIRLSVLCGLLVLAADVFGIWQPSTEIAFICDRSDHYGQMCLTDADRGGLVLLTTYKYLFPSSLVWSPDGRQIAFDGQMVELAPDGSQINPTNGLYVFDVSGGTPRLLVADGYEPNWSPDGTQILYTKAHNADFWANRSIYTTTLDGSAHLIIDNGMVDHNPVWSPDGKRIAFQAFALADYPQTDIYIVDADGSNLRRVTPADSVYVDPAWSPDGNRLALFWAGGWSRDVILLDLTSGAQQDLTDGTYSYDGSPAWSPDGKRIAFDSDVSRGFWQPRTWWIYVMNADGSGAYIVAQGRRPAWRPARVFSWDDLVR